MEASTLQPAATLPRPRITVGAPLLRLRSDEQLVALFRAGHDEAFRAIHDRYHKRLFAYARQMLPGRQDAEDALQDVFVRAYAGLRASDRDLALKAWLFRVAHNRCVDQLRKPHAPPPEVLQLVRSPVHDPLAEMDLRESMRRLVDDIRRLPDQQRSALLMRELGGMSYAELAHSLGVSVGAVKSLLVRARLALAQASDARETACAVIREQLVDAHDRGVRPTANARRHMRDCSCCKSFRRELRGVSRQLAAVAPTVGPLGMLAKLLGFSGGGGAAGGAGGGALLGGGGTGASAGGIALGTSHVATLIVAAVATAGGAVEIQHSLLPVTHHPAKTHLLSSRQSHHVASAQTSSRGNIQTGDPAGPALVVAQSTAVTPESVAQPVAKVRHSGGVSVKSRRAGKHSSLTGSSTTTAGSATTGASTYTSCTTASPVSPTAAGGGSTGSTPPTTTTASTTGTSAATSSTQTSPATSSECSSAAGSPAGASQSTSNSSATASGPATPGSTPTISDPAAGNPSNPGTAPASSGSSSGTTSG